MAVMGYGTKMSASSDIKDVFTISSCREIVMKLPVSCSVRIYIIIMQILKKKKNFMVVITFSGMGVPVPDFTAVTPAVTPVATATAATPPSTATTPTPDPQLQAAVCRALSSFTVTFLLLLVLREV